MYKGDAGLVKTIRTPPTNKINNSLKPYAEVLLTAICGNLFQLYWLACWTNKSDTLTLG